VNGQILNANAIATTQDVLAISKCKDFIELNHHQSLTLSTP